VPTLDETLAVLRDEGLLRYEHVIDGDYTGRINCLVLVERDGVWSSFFTDERASVVESSTRTYPDLSHALEDFVNLMRLTAREHRALNQISEENGLAFRERRRKGDSPRAATTAEGPRG
jgi:hypothetical protein